MNKKELIFDGNIPEVERKNLFAQLASLEDVEAYRTIERYLKSASSGLRNWAILALQESRMLLESRLLDENQVFISTGLGGKGAKLRYFVVLIPRLAEPLTGLQQKIVRNEFEISLRKREAEIENLNFPGHYATLLVIIPLRVPLKEVFHEAIRECNQYGNFLRSNFIVTNVRELGLDEIEDFLEKQEQAHSRDDG
jgi:hypothetical protein